MMLGQEQLDKTHNTLTENLIGSDVKSVMLIDTAGNVIASIDNAMASLEKELKQEQPK